MSVVTKCPCMVKHVYKVFVLEQEKRSGVEQTSSNSSPSWSVPPEDPPCSWPGIIPLVISSEITLVKTVLTCYSQGPFITTLSFKASIFTKRSLQFQHTWSSPTKAWWYSSLAWLYFLSACPQGLDHSAICSTLPLDPPKCLWWSLTGKMVPHRVAQELYRSSGPAAYRWAFHCCFLLILTKIFSLNVCPLEIAGWSFAGISLCLL